MARKSFLRQNSKLLKKLGEKWRKPRGRFSKTRMERAGRASLVKVGYRSPVETRGLHPSGAEEVLVNNLNDLNNVSENQVVRISSRVGAKKKLQILEETKKKGIKVLNANEVKLRTIANKHTKKKKAPKKEVKKEEKKETKTKETTKKEDKTE